MLNSLSRAGARKNSILKMSIYEVLANDLGVVGNLHGVVGEWILEVIWLRFDSSCVTSAN